MTEPAADRPAPSPGFPCIVAAWQAHETELRGYLRHRLSDRAAADDVLQDVFLKAMRGQPVFRGVASLQ